MADDDPTLVDVLVAFIGVNMHAMLFGGALVYEALEGESHPPLLPETDESTD